MKIVTVVNYIVPSSLSLRLTMTGIVYSQYKACFVLFLVWLSKRVHIEEELTLREHLTSPSVLMGFMLLYLKFSLCLYTADFFMNLPWRCPLIFELGFGKRKVKILLVAAFKVTDFIDIKSEIMIVINTQKKKRTDINPYRTFLLNLQKKPNKGDRSLLNQQFLT